MSRSCFNCRFRFRQLAPDGWGNRPWRRAAKGGYRLAWGQDTGCELWEAKQQRKMAHCSLCGGNSKPSLNWTSATTYICEKCQQNSTKGVEFGKSTDQAKATA